jgi:hypothetical protein
MSTENQNWQRVLETARLLPETEVGTSYGTPALRVRGRHFARLREDGETLVIKTNLFARHFLLESHPEVYYLTDHYRDYPYVLARLARISTEQLEERLEEAWRLAAPKRLVKTFDAAMEG